jgi:hypothetical protein
MARIFAGSARLESAIRATRRRAGACRTDVWNSFCDLVAASSLLRLYHRGALRSVGEPRHAARPARDAAFIVSLRFVGVHALPKRPERFTQCMSAFKYPNKNNNIIPIKITPTIPSIQKPSRKLKCSTTFLLPLVGQWLCTGIRAQGWTERPE